MDQDGNTIRQRRRIKCLTYDISTGTLIPKRCQKKSYGICDLPPTTTTTTTPPPTTTNPGPAVPLWDIPTDCMSTTNVDYDVRLTWDSAVNDLDLIAINAECKNWYQNLLCNHHGGAGTQYLAQDQLACCGTGEIIEWSGDFTPYSLPVLIYVENYDAYVLMSKCN